MPEVVEPEPVEQTMVVDPHTQLGVTENVDHTGLTGLTIRRGEVEATAPLNALQVDELLRLLGSTPLTVELFHRVLVGHQVDVDWYRRRDGYAWACSCLTDGEGTWQDAAGAWHAAARHQAEAIAAALSDPEVIR